MNNVQQTIPELIQQEQFRMTRLQVFNWGTFSNIYDIPISEKGFLFVGPSGSGKSTLLDAFSALLIPAKWLDFNAAAREAERSGRDRNLITYVRGAWAEQNDDESGVIAKQFLRPNTTWSALALTYRNGLNRYVTLVQLFWIRGKSNHIGDVHRCFLIFERAFKIEELGEFSHNNFDIRKLKHDFSDSIIRDKFSAYSEHFCRLLGIENTMALRLLHKTQSAKNLGDLNTFLRNFMLEKPQTFTVAERLVNEFIELNAAHQAVITARQQIDTLKPAREQLQKRDTLLLEQNQADELKVGLPYYCKWRRKALLQDYLAELDIQQMQASSEITSLKHTVENHQKSIVELQQQHLQQGGAHIEQWQEEQQRLQQQRDDKIAKAAQTKQWCQTLNWQFPSSPQGFAEMVGRAKNIVETWQEDDHLFQDKLVEMSQQKNDTEKEFVAVTREIKALSEQPCNIPAHMQELRNYIAKDLNIADASLPFVGELLEVKTDESAWQGAIERVLHGFALSLLVEERHYSALSNYLNKNNIKQRLVYYRTDTISTEISPTLQSNSLVYKLNYKDCSHKKWLQQELQRRFDYNCVDSIQAFRKNTRAITLEGQIKHNQTRHEKDDRHAINDKRHWILGFDNREKLALYKQEAQQLADKITGFENKIKTLKTDHQQQGQQAMLCQNLVNLTWQDIDPTPLLDRLDQIKQSIDNVLSKNSTLQQLSEGINTQNLQLKNVQERLRQADAQLFTITENINNSNNELHALEQDPSIISLTPTQKQGLAEQFSLLKIPATLKNLDSLENKIIRNISEQLNLLQTKIDHCGRLIENHFADYIRNWPADAEGLDAALAAHSDFMAKLTRLENDGLPEYEDRFFELLKNQSHQNLAALLTHLEDARKDIQERMFLVNESLAQAAFNQYSDHCTYMRIKISDKQLTDVHDFKQQLKNILSHAWDDNAEIAEQRFLSLRDLVQRLNSQEFAMQRWRELVLDVRLHVEFIGEEFDEDGKVIEIYRSGAGKSGGQRQKLATTCLAAALRYQLGGNDYGFPMYAPVILDEAFDKADNEFTTLAMNIFTNFGFQMIVATPLKAVMTLEPFIGGACFVKINDRKHSGIILIEYDTVNNKLDLP